MYILYSPGVCVPEPEPEPEGPEGAANTLIPPAEPAAALGSPLSSGCGSELVPGQLFSTLSGLMLAWAVNADSLVLVSGRFGSAAEELPSISSIAWIFCTGSVGSWGLLPEGCSSSLIVSKKKEWRVKIVKFTVD